MYKNIKNAHENDSKFINCKILSYMMLSFQIMSVAKPAWQFGHASYANFKSLWLICISLEIDSLYGLQTQKNLQCMTKCRAGLASVSCTMDEEVENLNAMS